MKKMKTMARQGDVLVISAKHSSLRPDTKKRLFGIKLDKEVDFKTENRVPLAYGEVSGHAHAIREEGTAILKYSTSVQDTVKTLSVLKSTELQHEEHEAIMIPKGDNAVIIQSEWRLQKIQRTAD